MGAQRHWHWALECSALLINHNQSCAITSIFLVNYCEGQVVQLRTRGRSVPGIGETSGAANPRKRTSKKKRWTQKKKKSQAHLHTCRRPNTKDVLSLIIYRPQRVLPVNTDGRGRTDTHNETRNLFPAVKMKSRNTKTIRSYDYDLLLLGCKIQACLLTRHKNVFPKVSIQ